MTQYYKLSSIDTRPIIIACILVLFPYWLVVYKQPLYQHHMVHSVSPLLRYLSWTTIVTLSSIYGRARRYASLFIPLLCPVGVRPPVEVPGCTSIYRRADNRSLRVVVGNVLAAARPTALLNEKSPYGEPAILHTETRFFCNEQSDKKQNQTPINQHLFYPSAFFLYRH